MGDNLARDRVRNDLPDLSVWAALVDELAWMTAGACRANKVSTAVFFVTDGKRDQRQVAAAKAWCEACPVRLPCAEYAMANPKLSGVWGGLTESQRQRMRRRVRRAQSLQTS